MDMSQDKTGIISKALLVPEILASIFRYLDTERLKRNREVCLAWSNEIARTFHTRVVPKQHFSNWSRFQELLDNGIGLKRLLCPFHEIYARIGKEVLETPFDWIHPPFPITRLVLMPNGANYYSKACDAPLLNKQVLRILQNCTKTLTHLRTPFWLLSEETGLHSRSFQLPRLTTLVAEGYERTRPRSRPPDPKHVEGELRFFLSIISGAPKLSSLALRSISCAPELLRRACLKKIEDLTLYLGLCHGTWEALNQIDTESLKSLRADSILYHGREQEDFLLRYAQTLELLQIPNGPCKTSSVFPAIRTLNFRVDKPPTLSLFPSLTQVVLTGKTKFFSIKPCLTVSDVSIHLSVVSEVSSQRLRVLNQLLRLFPCATVWRINYRALEDFCQVLRGTQRRIKKLEVELNCSSAAHPCICNRATVEEAAETDTGTFSNLRHLPSLRELELRQNLPCHIGPNTGGMDSKLLPYNVSGIQSLPQIWTLRIYAESNELPPDLISLEHVGIAIELLITSEPKSPRWSDPILSMGNLTISREKCGFIPSHSSLT